MGGDMRESLAENQGRTATVDSAIFIFSEVANLYHHTKGPLRNNLAVSPPIHSGWRRLDDDLGQLISARAPILLSLWAVFRRCRLPMHASRRAGADRELGQRLRGGSWYALHRTGWLRRALPRPPCIQPDRALEHQPRYPRLFYGHRHALPRRPPRPGHRACRGGRILLFLADNDGAISDSGGAYVVLATWSSDRVRDDGGDGAMVKK